MRGTAVKNFAKRTATPGLAFLGAGLSAIGVFFDVPMLTVGGAIAASFAAFVSAVWQAEWTDKIEAQSETIARQAIKIEGLITGGEGFVYCDFATTDNGHSLVLSAISKGEFPLYDVVFRICDVTAFKADPDGEFAKFNQRYPLGNITPRVTLAHIVEVLPPPGSAQQDYNLFFNGRNGFWTQLQRLRKVNGTWVSATKVLRGNAVLMEAVQDEFPRNANGDVDWD